MLLQVTNFKDRIKPLIQKQEKLFNLKQRPSPAHTNQVLFYYFYYEQKCNIFKL